MQKQESEIDSEELKMRLEALAERNPEAVAVFAARCALRVLPFTTDAVFDNSTTDQRENQQTIIVASLLGMEIFPIQVVVAVNTAINAVVESSVAGVSTIAGLLNTKSIVYEAASASNAIQVIVYAASASTAFNDAESMIDAAKGAVIVASPFSAKKYILDDLLEFERTKDIQKAKENSLWLTGKPQHVERQISAWLKRISVLGFNNFALIYEALLHGEKYPNNQIRNLVDDWYLLYGQQYTYKDTPDAENSTEQTPKTLIKYDQTHAHLYDGLAQKDSLGRQRLVDAMADILAAKENTAHQTIGLLGDWGAGKSTFIELLKSALPKPSKNQSLREKIRELWKQAPKEQPTAQFLFAEFNAWEYEHTDHMQAGVAREALKGLVTDLG